LYDVSRVTLIPVLFGAFVCIAILTVDGLAISLVSRATDSSLIGICGPVGSDVAIGTMMLMLAAGPFLGVWAGVRAGLWVRRNAATRLGVLR